MDALRCEELQLRTTGDVVNIRQVVRRWAIEAGFSLVDQTKLVTAASEIGRNTVVYGNGGVVLMEMLSDNGKRGIRITFKDQGPGIPDVNQALKDGYTTGTGMGLGLGGARRLVNEFEVESRVGAGTRVALTRWK